MNALFNLVLALAVPALTMILVFIALFFLDEPSTAPARGTPERRDVRRGLEKWGFAIMLGMWIIAFGGSRLGLRDDDRWLEWFFSIMGIVMMLLAKIDDLEWSDVAAFVRRWLYRHP